MATASMTTCPHLAAHTLAPPSAFTLVYRDECTQCFDTPDADEGLDVCLSCFNGGCTHPDRAHSRRHAEKRQHPIVLNIRRRPKPTRGDEPPQKITRLAIVAELESDKYTYDTHVHCLFCNNQQLDMTPQLSTVVEGVMNALTASKQSEVKAWEAEIVACEHIHKLEQTVEVTLSEQSLAHCSQCELDANLWLCLTCGNLGCGRRQYDGSGGNGHGLDHYSETGHALSCKLGTITPEGTADVYCYLCDDERLDPEIAKHLSHFGIHIGTQQKTEKSMAELQLEQNLKFDFSMTTEDGRQLTPLLDRLSCYMASVIQSLFALPSYRQRYTQDKTQHEGQCDKSPSQCFQCQMYKMADGLWSGRYSVPIIATHEDKEEQRGQEGITPSMFKALLGKDHPEFSTMRQQDAFEFFQHWTKVTEQQERITGRDPTQCFQFHVEERLQCMGCRRVRYTRQPTTCLQLPVPVRKQSEQENDYAPVSLEQCFKAFTADDCLSWKCPQCQDTKSVVKSTRLASFPEALVVCLRRFEFRNWVPVKLGVPVTLPKGVFSLEDIKGQGKADDEELLPETSDKVEASVNEELLGIMISMGLTESHCRAGLLATGNNNAEAALAWCFDNPETTASTAPTTNTAVNVPMEAILTVADMGFTEAQARKALSETNNSVERAVEWLFSHPEETGDNIAMTDVSVDDHTSYQGSTKYRVSSVVSHRGTSVHCGHYVAHIYDKENDRWVLFNDNKVVEADTLPESDMYVLTLERVNES
ncbi:ubiquitin carboxyl-terminal hydrolase [Syncephalis fuscata]|nr:ubiquitin carboxyl-terminal hydrolase [Syncephalis fuscata]